MAAPTVSMLAPAGFGGIVEGTPSGNVYTGAPGTVVTGVAQQDIVVMQSLGFTITGGGAGTINVGTITVGASPFSYTNSDGYPEQITIEGGTVSAVAIIRNAATTSLSAALPIIRVAPLDVVRVTYSVAPAMHKIPG